MSTAEQEIRRAYLKDRAFKEERAAQNTSHSWTDPRTSERWMVNADGVWRWAGGAWRFSGWRSAVSDQLLRLAGRVE